MRKIYRGLLIALIYSFIGLDLWMIRDYFDRLSAETHQRIEKLDKNLRKIEVYLSKNVHDGQIVTQFRENDENIAVFSEKLLQIMKNSKIKLDFPKKDTFSSKTQYYLGLREFSSQIPWDVPLDNYYISSHYGYRRDPVTKRRGFHRGVDLAANKGTKIYVPLEGEVFFAGRNGRYGKMIKIRHKNGFTTTYGHLRRILVKKGQHVVYRQIIGTVGKSGKSTGYHLHYEIKYKNKYENPYLFFSTGRFLTKG
jgi:murein DD-endopeptidase MepM/ murein hydrolase activator NlpD